MDNNRYIDLQTFEVLDKTKGYRTTSSCAGHNAI